VTGLGRRQRPALIRHPRRAQGQGLVEFAVLVPMFMLLLMGMLEFGLAFSHHQTLQYATREGARAGAALANGGGKLGCALPISSSGQSPNRDIVDPQIIAAVERVLTSDGSPVKDNLSRIPTIRIYLANADGSQNGGNVNVWSYNPGAGPVVDGKALDYSKTSEAWPACGRNSNPPAMALGVRLDYTYRLQTGLGAILGMFGPAGGTTIAMQDKTIMNINPTNLNVTP
jgi:Flp pilus assembly protein TadG